MDCGHLDFHDAGDEDGSNESSNVVRGKVALAHPFLGQCNACGEYRHKSAHCPQKWACWTCGDMSHRAAQCPNNFGKGKGKGSDHMTGGKGTQIVKGKGKKDNRFLLGTKGKAKLEKVPIRATGNGTHAVQSQRGLPQVAPGT